MSKKPVISTSYFVVQWHLGDFLSYLFSLAVKADFILLQGADPFFRSQHVLHCLGEEKTGEERYLRS